YAF
ncbi:hypothetical protein D020_2728B, partial [Vibrio parahaemolyticus SBR10290]